MNYHVEPMADNHVCVGHHHVELTSSSFHLNLNQHRYRLLDLNFPQHCSRVLLLDDHTSECIHGIRRASILCWRLNAPAMSLSAKHDPPVLHVCRFRDIQAACDHFQAPNGNRKLAGSAIKINYKCWYCSYILQVYLDSLSMDLAGLRRLVSEK